MNSSLAKEHRETKGKTTMKEDKQRALSKHQPWVLKGNTGSLLGKSFPLLHPVLTAHRKLGIRSNRKIKSLPSVFNKQIREVEGNLFQTGNHVC